MTLLCLIDSHEWDQPFYKKLANNDTGAAKGHQGGVVIPIPLRGYFPILEDTSVESPTKDEKIKAALYDANMPLTIVETRYQFQTRKGTRSPESRLTGSLNDLLNQASKDDFLLFQASLIELNSYRLTLVRKDIEQYQLVADMAGSSKNWGVLRDEPVLDIRSFKNSIVNQREKQQVPFTLFDSEALRANVEIHSVIRSATFRKEVIEQYDRKCGICGVSLESAIGKLELEAAHILPRSMCGPDDVRNGIALCRQHHWAFDEGLFSFNEDRKLIISDTIRDIKANSSLLALEGKRIANTIDPDLTPHTKALEWHRNNILQK